MIQALLDQIRHLPPHEQQRVMMNLQKLPQHERMELLELLEEASTRQKNVSAKGEMEQFAQRMNPKYLVGAHHRALFKLLERAANTPNQRIIVNIAPRMGKSEACSYLFPAWYLGHHPDKKIIMATHTAGLSIEFGRRVRDLVGSDEYKEVFPDTKLNPDAKAAGAWNTHKGGQYYAVGVGGALAGRGADLCIVPTTKVITKKGSIPAMDVQVGDELLGAQGWNTVKYVISSTHETTVKINALSCSTEHPVMVVGKGFISASQVKQGDKLVTPSLWVKIKLKVECILRHSTVINTIDTMRKAVFTFRK